MEIFERERHREALVRRRIKFVVEKGAMARLFKRGTHRGLQQELFRRVVPARLSALRVRDEYDAWLIHTVELKCWQTYSRNGLKDDRWGYFAKLLNIIVYEITTNRELLAEDDWRRLQPFLHLPIDSTVTYQMSRLDPRFPMVPTLKGMRVRLFFVGGPETSRRGYEQQGKSYLTRRRRGEEGDGCGSLTGGAISVSVALAWFRSYSRASWKSQ